MGEQKIRSKLKKLVIVFLIVCSIIVGVSRCLLGSVTELYAESVQGRLEERALQYKKSFLFKMNSDLQTLRAMACILEDTTTENTTPEETGRLLSNLWDAGSTVGFVRLCYFSQDRTGMQLTAQGQPVAIEISDETAEMQSAIQQALQLSLIHI